jgi:sulfhydrogenase subunit beta (sulfur reductase)
MVNPKFPDAVLLTGKFSKSSRIPTAMALKAKDQVIVARADFSQLLDSCAAAGYQVVGPTIVDGDLRYDALTSVSDLPRGWTDEQEGGVFRLKQSGDQALFGYGVGQHSWKQFLFLPLKRLWQAARDGSALKILPEEEENHRLAFLGVRACDLHALDIQDRVFMEGGYADPVYAARRGQALIIAVNCGGRSGGTCFCVSMGTGPKASAGFDLALTEVIEENSHYFVTEIGTGLGAGIMERVKHRPAAPQELEAAQRIIARRTAQMGRTLNTAGIKELLYRNYEHPRWDDVAGRCLTCGNCTMACPTCFCHTIEDSTDVTGSRAERRRRWDVCFTVDHSYLHGGSIRQSPRSRYRQWLTHKLATWIDQFGVSGCVGCGRCITWCPVAIDITEEAQAIRATEGK